MYRRRSSDARSSSGHCAVAKSGCASRTLSAASRRPNSAPSADAIAPASSGLTNTASLAVPNAPPTGNAPRGTVAAQPTSAPAASNAAADTNPLANLPFIVLAPQRYTQTAPTPPGQPPCRSRPRQPSPIRPRAPRDYRTKRLTRPYCRPDTTPCHPRASQARTAQRAHDSVAQPPSSSASNAPPAHARRAPSPVTRSPAHPLTCSPARLGPSPAPNTRGAIRTHDLRFRKALLYPAELPGHAESLCGRLRGSATANLRTRSPARAAGPKPHAISAPRQHPAAFTVTLAA